MTKQFNPEVIKAAAELAFPGKEWFQHLEHKSSGNVWSVKTVKPEEDGFIEFNPLTNNADAWALMCVLSRNWCFGPALYILGYRAWYGTRCVENESFPVLLLECVANLKGMELYL